MNRRERKRLFFALNPDAAVRKRIAAIQDACRVDARPVPPANFHITLAFLGMQEASVIPRVREVACDLVFPGCELRLDHVGRFRRAGVFWLGVSEPPEALIVFQQALVDGLLAAGIGYDRKPWKPHLTLYRKMRNPTPTMGPVEVRWHLQGFSLVESVSVNRGVEYHDIASWDAGV